MLPRRLSTRVNHLLSHSPAVVLLGPRQVGKTALALEIGATPPSVYLDLEDEDERVKLSNRTVSASTRGHRPGTAAWKGERAFSAPWIGRHGFIEAVRRKPGRAHFLFGAWPIGALEVAPSTIALCGFAAAFRAAFLPTMMLSAWSGDGILSALIWNGTFPNSARGYLPKPCDASGRCWRISKLRCSTSQSGTRVRR